MPFKYSFENSHQAVGDSEKRARGGHMGFVEPRTFMTGAQTPEFGGFGSVRTDPGGYGGAHASPTAYQAGGWDTRQGQAIWGRPGETQVTTGDERGASGFNPHSVHQADSATCFDAYRSPHGAAVSMPNPQRNQFGYSAGEKRATRDVPSQFFAQPQPSGGYGASSDTSFADGPQARGATGGPTFSATHNMDTFYYKPTDQPRGVAYGPPETTFPTYVQEGRQAVGEASMMAHRPPPSVKVWIEETIKDMFGKITTRKVPREVPLPRMEKLEIFRSAAPNAPESLVDILKHFKTPEEQFCYCVAIECAGIYSDGAKVFSQLCKLREEKKIKERKVSTTSSASEEKTEGRKSPPKRKPRGYRTPEEVKMAIAEDDRKAKNTWNCYQRASKGLEKQMSLKELGEVAVEVFSKQRGMGVEIAPEEYKQGVSNDPLRMTAGIMESGLMCLFSIIQSVFNGDFPARLWGFFRHEKDLSLMSWFWSIVAGELVEVIWWPNLCCDEHKLRLPECVLALGGDQICYRAHLNSQVGTQKMPSTDARVALNIVLGAFGMRAIPDDYKEHSYGIRAPLTIGESAGLEPLKPSNRYGVLENESGSDDDVSSTTQAETTKQLVKAKMLSSTYAAQAAAAPSLTPVKGKGKWTPSAEGEKMPVKSKSAPKGKRQLTVYDPQKDGDVAEGAKELVRWFNAVIDSVVEEIDDAGDQRIEQSLTSLSSLCENVTEMDYKELLEFREHFFIKVGEIATKVLPLWARAAGKTDDEAEIEWEKILQRIMLDNVVNAPDELGFETLAHQLGFFKFLGDLAVSLLGLSSTLDEWRVVFDKIFNWEEKAQRVTVALPFKAGTISPNNTKVRAVGMAVSWTKKDGQEPSPFACAAFSIGGVSVAFKRCAKGTSKATEIKIGQAVNYDRNIGPASEQYSTMCWKGALVSIDDEKLLGNPELLNETCLRAIELGVARLREAEGRLSGHGDGSDLIVFVPGEDDAGVKSIVHGEGEPAALFYPSLGPTCMDRKDPCNNWRSKAWGRVSAEHKTCWDDAKGNTHYRLSNGLKPEQVAAAMRAFQGKSKECKIKRCNNKILYKEVTHCNSCAKKAGLQDQLALNTVIGAESHKLGLKNIYSVKIAKLVAEKATEMQRDEQERERQERAARQEKEQERKALFNSEVEKILGMLANDEPLSEIDADLRVKEEAHRRWKLKKQELREEKKAEERKLLEKASAEVKERDGAASALSTGSWGDTAEDGESDDEESDGEEVEGEEIVGDGAPEDDESEDDEVDLDDE
jgi:hypothetical protein